ncbi:MAG: hypothetical protein ACRC6M_05530 [Microcystaceae cyanobacterium]
MPSIIAWYQSLVIGRSPCAPTIDKRSLYFALLPFLPSIIVWYQSLVIERSPCAPTINICCFQNAL